MNAHLRRNWRRILFACMLLILLPVPVFASQPAQSTAPIDPQVVEEMAANGQTTYWAILKAQADLTPAYQITDWQARGQFVYEQLTAVAEDTQSGLIAYLNKAGAQYQSFWIVNALRVTSDDAVLNLLAAQPEVERIIPATTYDLPEPQPAMEQPPVNGIEWNIDRIGVPQVWSTYAVRGEGMVVANIDTGAQYDHPALDAQYRGNLGGGNYDHNYNWYDPSNVCGFPSLVPCDNVGHGSHTMGTMVGDDGAANQIGVAPGARWIAAKGCEYNWCSDFALLASAQWVLAPTDLNGQNPRPDLRPNVVNNSWGGGGGNPWYQGMVQAWVASGIFPAFSNGNMGPGCGSSGSPGDYPESYAAGAFDYYDAIAWFSSRGPSAFGVIKPNLAAPGVDVRSSVPYGDGYDWYSGTSMASPHVAGTVALMWSAAPALLGDIAATRALLDQTAINMPDSSCDAYPPPGDGDNNNVWGEGKLDAYAAVSQSPMGPTGSLQGTVIDANTMSPMEGAVVTAVGPLTRSTFTDWAGQYSFPVLSIGNYTVTVTKFAYLNQTATGVNVSEGATTVQDFALQPAPSYSLTGTVWDNFGAPLSNAKVTILNTPIPPAVADANGVYTFPSIPAGSYQVKAEHGNCNDPLILPLDLTGDLTGFDFTLTRRVDDFGYYCQLPASAYVEASNDLGLYGDDGAVEVSLPFPFILYGQTYSTAYVSTNGFLNFQELNARFWNGWIPDPETPNAAIYPFWDDLYVNYGDASVRTESLGTAPDRQFIIEWRNVRPLGQDSPLDVEIILYENGQILTQYRNVDDNGRERGNSATIGIENEDGTIAFQYSSDQAVLEVPQFAVRYLLPPSAFVEGKVTDINDGLPIAAANIDFFQNGSKVRNLKTDAAGFYHTFIALGEYTIEASATNYRTESASITLETANATYNQSFALRTARAEISPSSFTFIVPVGESRTKLLTLKNTGSLDMTWDFKETGGGQAAATATAVPQVSREKLAKTDPDATTARGLAASTPAPQASIQAAGDILRSWAPTGLNLAWGVGYTGNVWLSDAMAPSDHEFNVFGAPTGRAWDTPWAGVWPGDMAYDAGRGWICQVNVGGDNGIYCLDPADGSVEASITGAFPWTSISQRGLAYRPDDDSFYIGGWNEGILYHIAGLSHPTPGAVLDQCYPPDGNISGLAWNPAFNIVWEATNSYSDTMYALDAASCSVVATLGHPTPGYNGAGLEMDEAGNLWLISQGAQTVYLMDSGIPSFVDVTWLSEEPSSDLLAAGSEQAVQITVDATDLEPGIYHATLFLNSNSGRNPVIQIPVTAIIPAYMQGVNVGGSAYVDTQGETWAADKAYKAGSWGYIGRTRTSRVRNPIAGTVEDPLYQDARLDAVEYRFDGLPDGLYEVDLLFAELVRVKPGQRLFDVIVEGVLVLPGHDIANEVGIYTADNHTFYTYVRDSQLSIRLLIRRSFKEPIINAIRVVHRPDK